MKAKEFIERFYLGKDYTPTERFRGSSSMCNGPCQDDNCCQDENCCQDGDCAGSGIF